MVEKAELDASELRAIEEHKWYLSEKSGKEVSIEEAIEDFTARYRALWAGSKLQQENTEQLGEIEKHQWYRSQEEGRDIGKERAAAEWIRRFAEIWRREKESLEANEFLVVTQAIEKEEGHQIEPTSRLGDVARIYDCEVYLHFPRMDSCNFVMNGKEYLSVKSLIFPGKLAFQKGDRIEFIVMGARRRELVDALRAYLEQ
ncbi:MAG: hypothetical protein AB1714_15480 [Acidobacteriota bacterium]